MELEIPWVQKTVIVNKTSRGKTHFIKFIPKVPHSYICNCYISARPIRFFELIANGAVVLLFFFFLLVGVHGWYPYLVPR